MKSVCLLVCLAAVGARAFDVDAVLRCEGERKRTFGPTGRRLFTERIAPGHGLRGHFCYIHHSELRDPLVLDGLPESPAPETVWYPSHLEVTNGAGSLTVAESKFITDDDVFVDVVRVTNSGAQAVTLPLRVTSGFATEPRHGGSAYDPIDLAPLANADPMPAAGNILGGDTPRYWYLEAEAAVEQSGSTGEDRKAAASGGQVLGMNFGGGADHFARYQIEVPALATPVLYVRAAKAGDQGAAGPAPWILRIDGVEAGRFEVPVTGGWGDQAEQFHWIALPPLPALSAGEHALRLDSTRDGNNTNFDGLLLAAGALVPPTAPPYPAVGFEHIAYTPGRKVIGGVPFELLDPATNRGHGVALLRVGESLALPAPKGDALHLVVAFAGEQGPATTLTARVRFEEGADQLAEMRSGAGGLRTLSVPLPPGRKPAGVRLERDGGDAVPALVAATCETHPAAGPRPELRGEADFFGVRGVGVVVAPGFRGAPLERNLEVPAGGEVSITIAMGVAEDDLEAERRAAAWCALGDPLAAHAAQYQAWFDENCPTFDSSDAAMDQLWAYRWFVARHCLSRAEAGLLAHPCFFEGMHGGWYPTQIDYSSPHIIDEVRWLRDSRYAFGQGLNHAAHPDANGVFVGLRVNQPTIWYTHWIDASLWGAFEVHPDRAMLTRLVDAMAADVRGHFVEFDRDGDLLCTPTSHWPTGMEWQPAFWYFSGYDNTRPDTPLERGDLVAYVYANARAVAAAYAQLGRAGEAAEFSAIADGVRGACLASMWFADDRWFYALEESTDLPALCKEIVGLYPFAFGLPPDAAEYTEALEYLFDEDYFWNPYPAATVAKDCPVYTPAQQQWPGPGGRVTGCMWNGPTWPHANSIVANAIANVLRDYDSNQVVTPERYWEFLDSWTALHFTDAALGGPNIQEYYHGETGAGWGCDDYFHSTWCDLVIRHVAGLRPSAGETLVLDPIPGPLSHFRLDRVRYHGHEVTITWNGDGHYPDAPRGFAIAVDGNVVARRADLGRLEIELLARR